MTHYEELGVSPDAPAEEIRRAFRRTSRLLHPDLQSVPELRQAAEVQMRRLNEIVEMLCQPEARAAYDRSLGGVRSVPAALAIGADTPRSPIHPSLIAGLAFGALAMFCWNIISSAPSYSERSEPIDVANNAPIAAANTMPKASSRASRYAYSTQRSAVGELRAAQQIVPEPISLPDSRMGAEPLGSAPPVVAPSVSPAIVQELPAAQPGAAAAVAKTQSKSLDGVWLLVREPHERLRSGEYAAEFVELRLHQKGDRFLGDYRSRYRVPSGLGSPEVNFRFEGTVSAQEFAWSGRSGSQGKVRLTLNSPDSMNIEWVAEARIPGSLFTEGSSKLVRLRTD